MDKLLLRPKEAAEMLGLSVSMVQKLIASGDLPAVRFGGGPVRPRWKVPADALRAWVAAQPLQGAK